MPMPTHALTCLLSTTRLKEGLGSVHHRRPPMKDHRLAHHAERGADQASARGEQGPTQPGTGATQHEVTQLRWL